MKLEIDIAGLSEQRKSVGAEIVLWKREIGEKLVQWQRTEQLRVGLEVDLEEVETGPDNLLTSNGEQVLVYIKDTRETKEMLSSSPRKRFHLVNCEHLKRMKREKRYDVRYVKTTRRDGLFDVVWEEVYNGERIHGVTTANLLVCQYCLDELKWKGFDYKTMSWPNRVKFSKEFSITEFFDKCATKFDSGPKMDFEVGDGDKYPEDWIAISEKMRSDANWICSECDVCLERKKQYLHVHHVNGQRSDCRPENLRTLCRECHAKQPFHEHMKPSKRVISEIEGLRKSQKSSRPA